MGMPKLIWLDMQMQMEAWPRIGMLSLGMPSLSMGEPCLEVTAKEALWLRSLIQQLFDNTLSPTTLFSNNQSAITLSKDHQYHARTKHIDVQFHFICWIIEQANCVRERKKPAAP